MIELNKLYNSDCMDKDIGLPSIPDNYFELAIVDPPYRDLSENQPTKDMRKNGSMKEFGDKPTEDYFKELFRVSKNQIIWGANNFTLPPYKGFVVWKKLTISEQFTMSMAELAYISEELGTTSKIFEYAPQGTKEEPRIHPTQKPVALYTWLINKYAMGGWKILDTHAGSGSCLVAAHRTGHDFVGYEINPEYYRKANKRIKAEQAQMNIFDFLKEQKC